MIKRMFLISIIASIVFGIHIYRNIFVTNLATQSKVEAKTVGILINPDMTFNGLIDQMTSIGLKTPLGIEWYAKYTGFDRNLQPGKFDVPLPVTVSELFKKLKKKTKTFLKRN